MNSQLRDGTVFVDGDVTVKTVTAAAYAEFEQQCSSGFARIDLQGVGKADSACLSLLISALRHNRAAVFQHLPSSVQALAELYDIQEQIHA